ncbi:hypothetical protein GL325_01495 [Aeromicrobium sp. 636]|uniref:Uncharacterized protein n=1 Tax=Aeromicrobium senzhongii TaxID=2663859 RepID=A0A8I0ETT0_9ACTN|nr:MULTISPECIES: hypothetical protein [Aeromicrobium]MBC9224987.1 hypothetical protein [Aeromicrobium senzhongii]MCQ3997098.1 hypothetical protein [Aeromicrobium sp. 636]
MRTLIRLAVVAAVALVLAACGGSEEAPDAPTTPTITPAPSRGVPAGVKESIDTPAGVVVGEGGQIHVVTYGSSSNPAVVRDVSAEGQTVTVDVGAVPGRAATMDYVPTTSTFPVPEGVDTGEPIVFRLGEFGAVTIESFAPGAQAWITRPE